MNVIEQTKADLFQQIGKTVLILQNLERLMADTLKHGSDSSLSVSQINALDKRTMGALITILRQRVELADTFLGELESLLQDRNVLIHSLAFQEWFDMDSTCGQLKLLKLLQSINSRAEHAVMIFLGYRLATSNESGTKPEDYSDEPHRNFVAEIQRDYLRGINPKTR